jgi:tetratricopeptide (TPR) repeat protein
MGNLCIQLGEYEKAISLFKRVIELDSDNAETWYRLGSAYQSVENYPEAVATFKRSISLNPFQEETHMNLAEIQYFQYRSKFNGIKKEEITQRLRFILSINPQNNKGQKLLNELVEDNRIQNNGPP